MANSENTQIPHLPQNAVKCRFFAQYWGTETFCGGDNHIITNVEWYTISDESYPNPHLKLKPLSKMTYEDICKLAEIIKEFNKNEDLNILIKYVRESVEKDENFIYRCSFYVADVLRKLGYAISFDKYSVEDLVSFGWVQLV